MRIINNIAETKPTRIISTCTKDEAFRLGSDWYTKIEMNDFAIRSSSNKYAEGFVAFDFPGYRGDYRLLP